MTQITKQPTSTACKLQPCLHCRWPSPCSHSLAVVSLECCLQSCSGRVQGCAIEHARAYCSSIAYNRIVQTRARQPAPALSNVNMGQPTEPQSQLPLVTCFSALLQLTCSSFHRAPLLGRAACCREDMHRRCAGNQDVLQCIYSSGMWARRACVCLCTCEKQCGETSIHQAAAVQHAKSLRRMSHNTRRTVTRHTSHVTHHTQRMLRHQAHH